MLHPIKHDYRAALWCGIAALATLTGRPTSVCRDAVQEVRGGEPRPVKGIYTSDIVRALRLLGYDAFRRSVPQTNRLTLAAFLRERTPEERSRPILVALTGHFVVVHGRRFVDSQTREPVPLRAAPGRRKYVEEAWFVMRDESTTRSTWAPPARVRPAATARVQAQRLARTHGIEIDTTDWLPFGHIWVLHPDYVDTDADPYVGDHIANSWEEALGRVQGYVEWLKTRA